MLLLSLTNLTLSALRGFRHPSDILVSRNSNIISNKYSTYFTSVTPTRGEIGWDIFGLVTRLNWT